MVQAYIESLLQREAYEEAARLSPRLLKDNAGMWERWAYLFAQTRQLPKLAPYIPTGECVRLCRGEGGEGGAIFLQPPLGFLSRTHLSFHALPGPPPPTPGTLPPSDHPRLKETAYEMVLRSLLVSPEDHALLLELVGGGVQGGCCWGGRGRSGRGRRGGRGGGGETASKTD